MEQVHNISLHEEWSTGRKLRFRYICLFFFLFIFPFPLSVIPDVPWLTSWVTDGWNALVKWAGPVFFGIEGEISTRPTGSGDTTYGWVQNFLVLLLALIGGTLWSVLDRKRKSYQRLWRWFHILVVYYVAYYLFFYGFIKVFGEQFGNPGISRMLETYGESSPMRIMWTFLSASESYEQFSGWSEAIAGFLILFRRTRTIGALAGAGVMLNVFTMNMTYDVPVKLFSFQLMIMCIYLASADYKRLLSVFITNRPVGKIEWVPMFTTPWKKYTLLVIQLALAGYMMYNPYSMGTEREAMSDPDRTPQPLYGIHDVDLFVINGDTIPPLTTDTVRWSKAFMDLPGFGGRMTWGIKDMQNNTRYLSAELDTIEQVLTLKPFRDTVNAYRLAYEFQGENLNLSGVFEGDTLQIETSYFNPRDFILVNRGFHWINEVPYNRRVPYKR